MNIYLIIVLITIFIILLIIAYLLHNSRSASTKAMDYFSSLKNVSSEKDNKPDDTVIEVAAEETDISVDENSEKIRMEQIDQYLMLLDMHRNSKHIKQLQENVDNIDEDEYNELNDYLSVSELAKLLGINVEETISFLIDEEFIEREHYTLNLTEKGIEIGGEYVTHEEVQWIEFPKDILNRLEHKNKKVKPKIKEHKEKQDIGFWFFVIVMVLVYLVFFRG